MQKGNINTCIQSASARSAGPSHRVEMFFPMGQKWFGPKRVCYFARRYWTYELKIQCLSRIKHPDKFDEHELKNHLKFDQQIRESMNICLWSVFGAKSRPGRLQTVQGQPKDYSFWRLLGWKLRSKGRFWDPLNPKWLQNRTFEPRSALGPSKNDLWNGVWKKH